MTTQSENLSAALATITVAEIKSVDLLFRNLIMTAGASSRVNLLARKYPVIAGLADMSNARLVEGELLSEDVRAGMHYVCFILGVIAERRVKRGDTSLSSALLDLADDVFDKALFDFTKMLHGAETEALFKYGTETCPAFFISVIENAKAETNSVKASEETYTGAFYATYAILFAAWGGSGVSPGKLGI